MEKKLDYCRVGSIDLSTFPFRRRWYFSFSRLFNTVTSVDFVAHSHNLYRRPNLEKTRV